MHTQGAAIETTLAGTVSVSGKINGNAAENSAFRVRVQPL